MSRKLFGALIVFVVLLLSIGSANAQGDPFDRGNAWQEMSMRGFDHGDDDDDDDGRGLGFGQRIAGAWLGSGTFTVDFGCDGLNNVTGEPGFDVGPFPFTDVQMFGVGGSRAVTNPANPNTGLGTWTKTGPRQVTGRDVVFGEDAGGNPLVSIVSIVVDFDPGYRTATTWFGANVYPGDGTVDPLDPASPKLACSDGQHAMFRKVTATE